MVARQRPNDVVCLLSDTDVSRIKHNDVVNYFKLMENTGTNQIDRCLKDVCEFSDVHGEHGSPTRFDAVHHVKSTTPVFASVRPSDDLLTLAPRKKTPVAGRRARDPDSRAKRRVMFADMDDVVDNTGVINKKMGSREDIFDYRPVLKRTGTPYRAKDDDIGQQYGKENEHVLGTRHTMDPVTSRSRLFDREYERLLKSASFDPSTDPLIRAYENRQTIIKSIKSSRCAARSNTSNVWNSDEPTSSFMFDTVGKPSRNSRRCTGPRTPTNDDVFTDDVINDVDKEIQLAIEMGNDLSRFHNNMYETHDFCTPVSYQRDVKTPVIDVMFQTKSRTACDKHFESPLTKDMRSTFTPTFRPCESAQSEDRNGFGQVKSTFLNGSLDSNINKQLWTYESDVNISSPPTCRHRVPVLQIQSDNIVAKRADGLKSKFQKESVCEPDKKIGPATEYSDAVSDAIQQKINSFF